MFAAEVIRQEAGEYRRAGETPKVGDAGADDSGFESPGLGDGPTGHVSAVTPAHDARRSGSAMPMAMSLVDAGLIVFVVLAAPVVDS